MFENKKFRGISLIYREISDLETIFLDVTIFQKKLYALKFIFFREIAYVWRWLR